MELGSTLIIGGAGYLGSHLAKHLESIQVYDRSVGVTQAYDTVIHAAHFNDLQAESEFIGSIPRDTYFVFFSSAAIYGETRLEGADVKTNPEPINDYGRYKLKLEQLVQDRFPAYLILRISNPYGGEPSQRGVYQIFKSKIEQGQVLNINANQAGEIVRDFIHIDDFISKTLALLEIKAKAIVNLSSGQATCLEDFARAIDSSKALSFNYTGSKDHEIQISVLKS
ncbi:MAG: SDR family oxidoreductase [Cyanobacteria bacterium]|nr:SDR family oxidoreductase [Cyanobacteriota bacterium]MDA1021606.1 SDR family oxidoreductase [Cyanobacteriota bacterium]